MEVIKKNSLRSKSDGYKLKIKFEEASYLKCKDKRNLCCGAEIFWRIGSVDFVINIGYRSG
jgi:hypothetical protein